ncbi:hypothetical protein SteCoe_18908 [Stentor coeruleus]|uniref:Uncharacterized protein n=1 Tax=Stentor coeruleus TaxID=5963 RepID=A0A1R2BVF6_9CILI|nr:hypothetical protein SteCoe_18908 [Stentor coeruleus]
MDSNKNFDISPKTTPLTDEETKNIDRGQVTNLPPMQIDTSLNIESKVFGKNDKIPHSPEISKNPFLPIEQPQNQSILINPQISNQVSQEKDAEFTKLKKEYHALKGEYLLMLENTEKLTSKIKSQDDCIQKLHEKYTTTKKSLPKTLEPTNRDQNCQDMGISPIRALNLTEKNDLNRIDELNKELEAAQNIIKIYESKQELMTFKAPEGNIDHLKYYEIIASLWKLVNSMQQYYNDCLQEAIRRTEAKCSIYEKQKSIFLIKIKQMQKLHCDKLFEMDQIEKKMNEALKNNNVIQEKYERLNKEFNEYKTKVTEYKADVTKKLAKARADVDIVEELKKAEGKIKELEKNMEKVKSVCEQDKIEFLQEQNREKKEIIKSYEERIEKLSSDNELLKLMRSGK